MNRTSKTFLLLLARRQPLFTRLLSTRLEFTKDRYPIHRKPFASLTDKHRDFFEGLLGKERILSDEDECEPFNIDWVRNVRGMSRCVLKPKSTGEVAAILRFCNEESLAVCPQGGNTGLVGGSVPVFDEIVLSTTLMNGILSVDAHSGAVVCEAGCVLQTLDDHLAERGLMVPLDLGAKASCQLGGNIATNAGGLRLLRYGNLHGSVLGLEAVKANGEVIDCLSTLRKDNTGYHLKHLFIGSEGTLGVVTKVALQCPTRSTALNVAFMGMKSFEQLLRVFNKAKSDLSEILSSFELIDQRSLHLVEQHYKTCKNPLSGEFPFYALIETQGCNAEHDEEKLTTFLAQTLDSHLIADGLCTAEPSKIRRVWELRESITSALQLDGGYVYKYDLSLPIGRFYEIVEIMRKRLGDDAETVCGYGHVGDSNLHLNITVKQYSEAVHQRIEPFVYEYTSAAKGSISAEHGIGFRKTHYLGYSKSLAAITMMRGLKQMMDPKGILNPYKVLE